ncbi:MAG: FMN-binding glutamate synthase family protein [Chitinophagaceae bacterium]|jgi:glutamate synthase domain-containing protein 2|nr:FMN-binding glutamate synthase family protein [Chitinophagaceae bacterium]MBP6047145.1 FMN-binding glutamate synthase family protein [Ferruginibacter sp.]MBK7348108.1 FMN-binding glutamate synthase family protein [Chitinophagaceae bacterium]MBK8929871.1 FMN-binding glutamate synthase family protein [Chitinophagaceae bacterium]MBP6370986.1 FMN-binding glutamate synthase family protein [Ferruginibacter sp.]
MRRNFVLLSTLLIVVTLLFAIYLSPNWYVVLGIIFLLTLLGYYDMFQKKHSVMRIYPVLGRLRFLMEELRPKIYQYFIESDIDGRPINRIDRSTIYQRSKQENDTMPFGTQLDVYADGYEWVCHSMAPKDFKKLEQDPRVMIGNKECSQPYSCSIYNIAAMSYGALSANAVEAMNAGAKIGGFAHNTGEGGISNHHLKHGGDIIWQIGTGYFGCRTEDGNFDDELFQQKAQLPQVKMIEIKISQGAKPGHGGILPASKNSPEIAAIRHIKPHTLVESPPYHKAFSTPKELIQFINKLRQLSGGKPVGFKLCIGHKSEFIAICKAMMEANSYPDFITVDGAEGGTGAAPQEFSNYVGAPLLDGLDFVHNILTGLSIRQHIRILASGKILTGFHIIRAMALGADVCYTARAMMMAVGCIQALLCNTNKCPVGVATQDTKLTVGLVVDDKKQRVANFHRNTIKSVVELLGASGLERKENITRSHIYRRVSFQSMATYEEIFPSYAAGSFLTVVPDRYKQDFKVANADYWGFPNIGSWSHQ